MTDIRPDTSWDVDRCRGAFLSHHTNGIFRESAALIRAMRATDERIEDGLERLTGAARAFPFELTPPDGVSEDDPAMADAATVWKKVADPALLDELGAWEKMAGFSVAQVSWKLLEARGVPRLWIPRLSEWPLDDVWWDSAAGVLKTMAIDDQGRILEVPIVHGTGKWVLFPCVVAEPWRRAAFGRLITPWLARRESSADWAHWSRMHGGPIRTLEAPVGLDEAEKEEAERAKAEDALFEVDQTGIITLPFRLDAQGNKVGYGVGTCEPSNQEAWKGFDGIDGNMTRRIDVELKGATLTTDTGRGGGGAFALGEVHQQVEHRKAAAVVVARGPSFRSGVFEPWALYQLGDRSLAPSPCWDTRTPEERKQEAEAEELEAKRQAEAASATAEAAKAAAGAEMERARIAAEMIAALARSGAGQVVDLRALAAAHGLPAAPEAPAGATSPPALTPPLPSE